MFNWTNVMVYEEHLKDIRREAAHDQLVAAAKGKSGSQGTFLAWVLSVALIGIHAAGRVLHI